MLTFLTLTPLWQQSNEADFASLILWIVGIVLLIVFWNYWQRIEHVDAQVVDRAREMAPNEGITPSGEVVVMEMHGEEAGHGHEPEMGETAVTPEGAEIAAGEPETPDDLTRIEGIGPKIAELLNEAGIRTYEQLADTPAEKLEAILESAGARFKLADPDTWPNQAQLAAADKWVELQELQDALKGGREEA